MKNTEWIAPAFIVVAILAVYLSLTYLPLSSWGITIQSELLWSFLPWIVAITVGLFVLKELVSRRN
jgi:hypothetical protein